MYTLVIYLLSPSSTRSYNAMACCHRREFEAILGINVVACCHRRESGAIFTSMNTVACCHRREFEVILDDIRYSRGGLLLPS